MPARETLEVADIHQRLDSISRHIEQMSRPAPRQDMPRSEPAVARQLNDAISRLDARLAQISNPPKGGHDWQRQSEAVEHAAAQVYRQSPPLSPVSLDSAIAEIAARQNELDSAAPRQVAPRSAPPIAPTMPSAASPAAAMPAAPSGPDFSSLERYLVKITSQIEAWRPDAIEQSIVAFRNELAEIRSALTEAMPRRAIESMENEIRSLSRRIDDTRQNGIDGRVLSGIEHALNEIREALRSLTPAEQLTGYDEAIHKLGAKLDTILRSNEDPSTVQQLEGAIAGLRSIVTNIASNEALGRLSDDLHALSTKVDQLARSGSNDGSIAGLEQRIIAALNASLEGRERPVAGDNPQQFESAVRALSDRLDRMPVGSDSASAFAHLEQRVSYLLERLEASTEHRGGGNLSRVEEGLQDILRHLENQQASFQTLASGNREVALPQDSGIADIVKRELSDIRFSQTERDRHTQDSLEAVHNTLGHVVDRLAMIEGDLRAVRTAPAAPSSEAPAASRPFMPEPAAPHAAIPVQPKPELPNPAAREVYFDAAPREFHSAQPHPAALAAAAAAPKAISEILEPQAAPARASVAAGLPPDHPLEPGTRPNARQASPSERIAASENAISAIKAAPEPASSTNFIAAARRAAQAAAAAQVTTGKANAKPAKTSAKAKAAPAIAAPTGDKSKAPKQPSTISSKIRSLLVGASVVMIVLGSFKMAMTVLDSSSPPPPPVRAKPAPSAPAAPSMGQSANPPAAAPAMPSMTAPTPIDRQSYVPPASGNSAVATIPIPQAPAASPAANGDVTGSIPAASPRLGTVRIPPTETLPDAIGGPVLRAAALKGDPTAAYEIGVRYAEGKGVTTDLEEAAKWYDRAAQAGVVPAIFRLGTLYEKGMGVKKDTAIAQRYYLQAADRGNAKAMHNLAVLFADGGGNGSDYKTAAQWFRKAADRGVADSQFNLGILYARGIGVEQNLAESYKWFSLAAAQGDADAGHKRDDIAKQLDAQSLAAAQLAIQTFKPEPQPNDATNVATPPGGWDTAAGPATAIKPAKPIRRASR